MNSELKNGEHYALFFDMNATLFQKTMGAIWCFALISQGVVMQYGDSLKGLPLRVRPPQNPL